MPHISLPDFIQHTFRMVLLPPHQRRQIQIITVCHRILSDRKPVVIVVLKNPFRLFRPVPHQIDVRLHQLIHLALGIQLSEGYHLLNRTFHPVIQFNPPRHISDIFLQDLCDQKFRHPAVLAVFLLVLKHFDLVRQSLVRRNESKRTEVTPPMEELRPHHIFDLVGIPDEILRTDLGTLYLQKLPFRLDSDRHKSPCILHDRQRPLRRLRQIFKKHPFPGKRQEETFLLLDPYQEFLQSLVSQEPFSHIIIQIKDTLILILQNLIELS